MFTGLIRHVGKVEKVAQTPAGRRLTIELGPLAEGLGLGDSVAVNGACLSAVEIAGAVASFDVIRETLARTTLGALAAGSRVNLERALAASDALEGHLVQGHVDGQATVRRIDRTAGGYEIEFDAGSDLLGQMVPKGSVAIDGVSLTLASVGRAGFTVALIPATLADTTLGGLGPGSAVNVETDVIGKYVLKYLSQLGSGSGGGVTIEKLMREGFA
jgi:riboflavin synthase